MIRAEGLHVGIDQQHVLLRCISRYAVVDLCSEKLHA